MTLKSELSPIEDRGVVFGLVHGAAGLDAAVHRRPDQADRGVLRADSRSRRVDGDLRLPDRRRRQRGAAPEAVGGAHAASSSRSPTSCGRSSRRCPARSRSRSIRRRSASRSARRRSSSSSCRRSRTRSCSGSSTASSTRRASIPGVQNLQTDLRLNTPEVRVRHQPRQARPTSASPVDTVGRTLETMLGGRQVTRFKRDGEQYDVIVQVAPVDRTTPADISDSYVRGARRQHGAAVQPGRRQGRRRAAVAQPLQPAARREDHRRRWRRATRSTRRCARWTPRRRRRCRSPRRPTSTASRANSASRARRSTSRSCWRSLFIYLVLSAQFESFVASVRDHAVGAAVDDRRAVRAVAHRRHAEHLQPGRAW